MENVKGLLNHDNGNFLFDICQEVAELGYFIKWKLISAKHYGPPQNRERVYFVGFRNFCEYKDFKFPDKGSTFEERCRRKAECIDLNKTVESCYYAENAGRKGQRMLECAKKRNLFVGDFCQWRVDKFCKTKKDLISTFCKESQPFDGMSCIVDNAGRLRSLTVGEVAYIQGFMQDYKFNVDLSPRVNFGLIGNSISIWVVKLIFEEIRRVILLNGK